MKKKHFFPSQKHTRELEDIEMEYFRIQNQKKLFDIKNFYFEADDSFIYEKLEMTCDLLNV
jgi:hypothetical protein